MQSATERRDLRRSIRNVLGTSREEAPTARQVINAATYLRRMMAVHAGHRGPAARRVRGREQGARHRARGNGE
jgi:hypothetical protein